MERRCAITKVVRPFITSVSAVLDAALGGGVHAGGRVVQDQDARLGEEGAGDRHALALAAREGEAALAHERVEPVRQVLDQLGEAGLLGGAPDLLLARLGTGVGDVLAELAENRKASSDTTATSRRSDRRVESRTSTPSTSTAPSCTS